jgi:putative transposase
VSKSLISSTLSVSRRNLYNNNTKQREKDNMLKDQILKVLEIHPSYGHRRIAMEISVGKKRVRRVMKLYGIKPYKRKAGWIKKRDWGKPDSGYPNLVKGTCPIRPGVVYAGDFTRLYWNRQVFYLATFIDLYSREVVGWSVSIRHTKELVIEAFLDAVINTRKPLIVHTDQGSEYKSQEYTGLVNNLGVKISMSAKASPWENAYQESFYNNFKTDLGLEFERFETIGQLVEAVHQTIKYYNNYRIHTKLKMSPARFRTKHQTKHHNLTV